MSKLRPYLADIASAIREKKGSSEPINAKDFSNEIRNLPSGSESDVFVDNTGEGARGIKKAVIKDGVESLIEKAFNEGLLEEITLPDSLKKIGRAAFYGTKLKRLVIPPLVVTCEIELAQNCGSLTEVQLPEGLREISGYAFKNCTSLPKIVIPSTIILLRYGQEFYGCTNLRTIVIKAISPPTLNTSTFGSGATDRLFYVPDESVDAYKSATNWSAYADAIRPLSELPNE